MPTTVSVEYVWSVFQIEMDNLFFSPLNIIENDLNLKKSLML